MPPLRTYDAPSQALEVDIDSSSLPTLAIVAPTPRAFTFPDPHTLNVSPYSTPINSPFEPDLYPLTHTSPPSSCLPSHSQDAFLNSSASLSTSSITSFYSSYKQASLDERRPQKGDDDYIKRPENAFILFRRKCCEDHQQAEEEGTGRHGHPKKQRQADLSKSISRQWKALSAEDRRHWENQAKEKKLVHQQMYPDYVYLPKRVRDQDGKARNKKYTKRRTTKAGLKGDANVVTAYVVPPQQISRSTSAPTPPPSSYQTIHIPNVYPSSSSSFSLLPMISRRAGYTGNANDTMSNFDFPPSNLPAPLYTNPSYGMGLQTSEFDQSIFDYPGQNPKSGGFEGAVPLQPPILSIDSLSTSSSAASSPVSGPFTPASVISSYYHFSGSDKLVGPPGPDAWDLNQQSPANLDIQTGVPVAHEMGTSFYPWDTSAVWQTEPSMLLQNDFNLDVIPPIELKATQYSNSPPFVEFPGGNLPEAGYGADFGNYPIFESDSEVWNST